MVITSEGGCKKIGTVHREIKYAYYNWSNQAEPLPNITAYCNNQLIQAYNVGTQSNDHSGLVYKEPIYKEPIHEEPIYKESMYKEPLYKEPIHEEPTYKEPMYKEPLYEEPLHKEPIHEEPINEEPVQKNVESAQRYYVSNNYKTEPVQTYYDNTSNGFIKEETYVMNQEKCSFEEKYLEKELSNHLDILVDSVHTSFRENFDNRIDDSVENLVTPNIEWEKYSNRPESFEDIIEGDIDKELSSEDQSMVNKNITHFTSSSLQCSISDASIKLMESKSIDEELENSTFNLREQYNWNEKIETTNIEQSKDTHDTTMEYKQVYVTNESKGSTGNINGSTDNQIDTEWNQLRKKLSSICINDEDIYKYESIPVENEEPNVPIFIRNVEPPKCYSKRNKATNNIDVKTKKNHEIRTNTKIENKYKNSIETVDTVETKVYKSIECLTSNDFPKHEITKVYKKSPNTFLDHKKSIEFNKPVNEKYTVIVSGVSNQNEPTKTKNPIQKNQMKTVPNNLKTNNIKAHKYNNIHNSSPIYELKRKKPENLKKLKSNPFIIKEVHTNEKRYCGLPMGKGKLPILKNQKIPNLKVHVQKPLNVIITPPKIENKLSKNGSFKNNETQRKEIERLFPEKKRNSNRIDFTIPPGKDSDIIKTDKKRDLFIKQDPLRNNVNIFPTDDPSVTNVGFMQKTIPHNEIKKPCLENLESFSSYETSNDTLNKLAKVPMCKTADSISISNFFQNNHDDFTKFILRNSKDDVVNSSEDNRRSNSSLGLKRNNTMDSKESEKKQYNIKKENSTMSNFFKWYKPQSEKEYVNDANIEMNKGNNPFKLKEKMLDKIYSNKTPVRFISKPVNLYTTNQSRKSLDPFSVATPTHHEEYGKINENQKMKSESEDPLKDKMNLDKPTYMNTDHVTTFPEIQKENKANFMNTQKDNRNAHNQKEATELGECSTGTKLPTIELNNESIRQTSSISQADKDKIMNDTHFQLLRRKTPGVESTYPINNAKKHQENKTNGMLSMRSTPLCDTPKTVRMRPKSISLCNKWGTYGTSKHSIRSSTVGCSNQKQSCKKEIKRGNKIKQPYYCCKPWVTKDTNVKTPRIAEKPKKELKIAKHLRNSFRKSSWLEEFSPDRYEVIESVVDRNKWKNSIQPYERNGSKQGTYYDINKIRNRTESKERNPSCCVNLYKMKEKHGRRNKINTSPMIHQNAELICRVVPKASIDMKSKNLNSKKLAFNDTVRLSSRVKQSKECMNCFQGRNKRKERVLAVTESYRSDSRRSNSVNNKMKFVKMNHMVKNKYRLTQPKELIATNSLSKKRGIGKEENFENCNICSALKECKKDNTNKGVERQMSGLRITFENSMEQLKMKLRDIPHTLKAKQKKRNGYITTQIS